MAIPGQSNTYLSKRTGPNVEHRSSGALVPTESDRSCTRRELRAEHRRVGDRRERLGHDEVLVAAVVRRELLDQRSVGGSLAGHVKHLAAVARGDALGTAGDVGERPLLEGA